MSTSEQRRAAERHAELLAAVADVRQLVLALVTRVDAMERRAATTGPRPADVALVLALADSIGTRVFAACDVYAHISLKADHDLAEALQAADIDNPRGFGWWLRRMAGVDCEGFSLVRQGDGRNGTLWQVTRLL